MILTGALKTRPTPTQARARERVHAILQATARLLEIEQPLRITTSMIADEAGIPVSSIYRYFASVEDVLRELYMQAAGEVRVLILSELGAPEGGWRTRMRRALAAQVGYIARHPYYRPLMLLFLSHRSHIAIDDEEHGELVRFLEARWCKGLDGFSGGDPGIVARMVVQASLSVEDMVAADLDLAEPLYAELAHLLEAYLSRYLND